MRDSAGYAQGTISAPSKAPMNILFMIKNSTVVCQVWLSPKKVKKSSTRIVKSLSRWVPKAMAAFSVEWHKKIQKAIVLSN